MRLTQTVVASTFFLLLTIPLMVDEALLAADTQPPSSFHFTSPRPNNASNTFPTIAGTVENNTPFGVRMYVYIGGHGASGDATGDFWTGRRWVGAGECFKKTNGCPAFSIELPMGYGVPFSRSKGLPSGKHLHEGWYKVTGTAIFEAGNRASTYDEPLRILIDRTPPKIAIQSPPMSPVPGRGEHHRPEDPYIMKLEKGEKSNFPPITGVAEDTGLAGHQSGLTSVEVMIGRKADNLAWDGIRWSRRTGPFCSVVFPSFPSSTSWSCSGNLPGGENLPLGQYVIYARASDKAHNVSNTIRNVLVQRGQTLPQDVQAPAPQPPTASPPARPAPPEGEVNLIVNGSFEDGPSPGQYLALTPGSTQIAWWTVTRSGVDYIGSYWQASHGQRSIDLDGTPGYGGIKQTFATTAGQRYRVSFNLSGNPEGPPRIKKLGVNAAGQSAEFLFDVAGKNRSNMSWATNTWEFSANGPTTTIEFYSLNTEGAYCGPVLDNVSVVPAR